MVSGLEAWLVEQVGASMAKKVLLRLAQPSFGRRLVNRVRNHDLDPPMTLRERWLLRRLVTDRETWSLLLDLDRSSATMLAKEVDRRVLRVKGSVTEWSTRAHAVAESLQAEALGALEMGDAFAALSSQVRSVDGSVSTVQRTLDQVGGDVRILAEGLGQASRAVDPDVLLRGPIAALGLTADQARAEALAETAPTEAAKILSEIADLLEAEGYGGLARPLRVDRARLLTRALSAPAAAAAWMPLVFKEIADGAGSVCHEAVTAFEKLANVQDAPPWLEARAGAIDQMQSWFRNPGLPSEDLLESACAALEAGDPEAEPLLLLAAEAALALNDHDAIMGVKDALTVAAGRASEETAVPLRLVLAEALNDEAEWQALLQQADPAAAAMATRLAALVYARRGRYVFWAGDPQGAELAFRSAVERACRARLWQDAAEWMLSQLRILSRASVLDERISELASRAAAVRATGPGGLLQRGYDPHTEALRHLLADKLTMALPELRRFLRDSVRVAHLDDELEAHRRLGELYDKTKREPAAAITHFVIAGHAKEAARVAGDTPFYVDCSEYAKHPQAQTRAAALEATAAQADLIPDSAVDEWTKIALDATRNKRTGFVGPQAWVNGYAVLAGLSERLPAGDIDAVLASVDPLIPRKENRYTWADDSIVDILAGLAVSRPERRQDVAARMIAIFDADDPMTRRLIHRSDAVATCLNDLRNPLRQCASAGHRQASQLLAMHGDTDPAVVAAADAQVTEAISRPPAYGEGHVSGLADVALTALVARCLPVERRIDLARDYVNRGLDDNDIEGNRAQAIHGCAALSADLPVPVRRELFDRILPIAQGNIQRSSPFDEMSDDFSHPLSSFQIKLPPNELRHAAVTAAARLASDEERAKQPWRAAQSLLRTGNPADSIAAARTAYTLSSNGFQVPVPWDVFASSSDVQLRQAAAALLATEQAPDHSIAEELARDSAISVRREVATALTGIARRDAAGAGVLAAILIKDPNYSVRQRVPSSIQDAT
jgi:hypothetical protein